MRALMLAMPFNKNKKMEFYPDTGVAHELPGSPVDHIHGNMHFVEDHCIAIYAENGVIYFQIDKIRWPLDDGVILSYRHDVSMQVTNFSISDGTEITNLTYPAWWKGLGNDVLAIPEMDEDEDYLAYACSVWRNEALRHQLLKSW